MPGESSHRGTPPGPQFGRLSIRALTTILVLVALGFYAGFILLTVSRTH